MCVTLNRAVTHLMLAQANITRSYVCLRFYLHDPLGEKELKLAEAEPEFTPGVHYPIGNHRYPYGIHSRIRMFPAYPR